MATSFSKSQLKKYQLDWLGEILYMCWLFTQAELSYLYNDNDPFLAFFPFFSFFFKSSSLTPWRENRKLALQWILQDSKCENQSVSPQIVENKCWDSEESCTFGLERCDYRPEWHWEDTPFKVNACIFIYVYKMIIVLTVSK